MALEMACVLLVTRDESVGDPIADQLEADGHEVICCPGPHDPFYLCPGAHDRQCPLATCSDVVVLDGWLATDQARRGVPSWHLLLYYRHRDIPVVALVGPDGLPGSWRSGGLVAIPRLADAHTVAEAVESLVGHRRAERSVS